MNKECKLVIESVTEDGKVFRPSDWVERISATLATFGPDHRLHYSKKVHPGVINNERCLVVDEDLEQINPVAFEYIVSFAKSNRLRVHQQCTAYALAAA